MISTSVSNLALYELWSKDEDLDVGWLLTKLLVREETPAMSAGTAFHSAMETVEAEKEYGVLSANGYRFNMLCDVDIELPYMQEVSIEKQYGDLLVRGRVDAWSGGKVSDFKTTEQFDPDRFVDRITWRLYLDMTDAIQFDWHIFLVKEVGYQGEKTYDVYGYHKLTEYRYPGMHEDCLRVAEGYREFAERYPELRDRKPHEDGAGRTGQTQTFENKSAAGTAPTKSTGVAYVNDKPAEPDDGLFGESA
jgi:hypothetical protein